MREKLNRSGVRPLHIIEGQYDRLPPRQLLQQGSDGLVGVESFRL